MVQFSIVCRESFDLLRSYRQLKRPRATGFRRRAESVYFVHFVDFVCFAAEESLSGLVRQLRCSLVLFRSVQSGRCAAVEEVQEVEEVEEGCVSEEGFGFRASGTITAAGRDCRAPCGGAQ